MKKIIAVIAIGFALFTALAPAVFSAPDIGYDSGGMAQNIAGKAGYDTSGDEFALSRTIGGIIRAVISMVGVVFLILIVYAGVLWGTSSGNEEHITKAKSILKSSLIGLIIVTAAYGITALVFNFIIGASAPSTDVGGDISQSKMGCCYSKSKNSCLQTATLANCTTKWTDGFYYDGESCTPYISQNTGCKIQFE